MTDRDPRFDWHEVDVSAMGGPPRSLVFRGACRHVCRTPVATVAGELVGQLCLTCDAEIPVGWEPEPPPPPDRFGWLALERWHEELVDRYGPGR